MHNLNYKGLVSDIQGRIKNSTSSQARRKAKALGRPLRMFFEKQALSFIIIDKYPTIKHNKDGTFIFQHRFQSDHLCQIRHIGKLNQNPYNPESRKGCRAEKCAPHGLSKAVMAATPLRKAMEYETAQQQTEKIGKLPTTSKKGLICDVLLVGFANTQISVCPTFLSKGILEKSPSLLPDRERHYSRNNSLKTNPKKKEIKIAFKD